MKRKLVQVGNSLAVTLPHDLVEELALQPGMEVDAAVDPRDGSFIVRAGVRYFEAGEASARFRKMVDSLSGSGVSSTNVSLTTTATRLMVEYLSEKQVMVLHRAIIADVPANTMTP